MDGTFPFSKMACVYNACNADTEHEDCHNNSSSPINMCKEYAENLEESIEDDEEEEDTDFNPFLVAEASSEASSSLSSDDDVSGHILSDHSLVESNVSLNHIKGTGNPFVEAVKHVQYVVHMADCKGSVCEMPKKNKNLDFDSQKGKVLTNPEANVKLDSINNIAENTQCEKQLRQSTNAGNSQKMCTELDNEDAICRRTRARHSLANYTLEELETFLQESDDEDNLHNIDDEEEYNKFLAAVLQGADQDGTVIGDDVDCDEDEDEDEENDVDFEIEIEEALESDSDDFSEFSKHLKRDPNEDVCGPQTRQKRCQNNQKKLVGPSKMTLRPILPSMSNAQVAPVPQLRQYMPCTPAFSECSSLRPLNADFVQGFTGQQIGQLYYLMLEHIQLLIQIFSLCVLDPSRQHIAQNVRNMIIEMTEKREAALARKKVPYPTFCFDNLHIHQSDNCDHYGCPRGSSWIPSIKSPIFSVFDVATLGMVKRYMTDVSAAVLKYRDSQVDVARDKSHMIKQPLFHWSSCACEASEVVASSNSSDQNATPLSSTCKRKMSLAATLVENTKKQSIAHVPKGIADLAQRFVPLFNPELFPRKPPIPAVANRVLFTESEDRLLAMGLIEYNNNWVAIQQRFLPCKSKNQIFVRQKNRSSSKSPDNPIKIVRRMKTSPLTANELILISEGLKIFKNDWNTIWRFYMPYRDPSLLPRQWRIATGTQKSYRKSDVVRQKRNAYEAKRRKLKASSNVHQATSEKEVEDDAQNSTDNNLDEDDEAYVHEAFLAESEPGSSKFMRPPTSQAGVSTHQMHNANPVKVVKLAPGLPPVNLPPSVRVISQSAFKSYNSLQSHPNTSDGTCDPLQRLPDVKNGNTLINPKPDNKVSTSHTKADGDQDSNSRIDHFPTEGHYLESDDTVHPLLLRTSGNGYQAHGEYQHNASTSSFLLSNQLKQPDGIIGPATKHSKESPLNLHTIDFHPVLRGNDSVHGDSGNESQDNDASDNLHPFCTSHSPNFNSSNCVINVHEENDSHHVPNAESSGRYENESEIDLDIHLSTRYKGEKAVSFMANCRSLKYGKPSVYDKRMIKSILPAKDSSIFQENCRDATIRNPSSPYSVVNVEADFTSGASGGISCIYSKNHEGGADFPEIVMEQEELSDSDEEIEHVEFEHEEMDDSDDDQIHGEYISEIQSQEINSPTEGDENSAEENHDQPNASCFNMSESNENSGNSVQTNLCLDSLAAASFPPSKQRQAGTAFSPGCSQTHEQSKHRQYKARKAKSSNSCSVRRKKSDLKIVVD